MRGAVNGQDDSGGTAIIIGVNVAPTVGGFEASSIVYAHMYSLFNWTVADGNGVSDIKNSTIELSNGVIVGYDNATDTFSKIQDTDNCFTFSYGAIGSLNSTALKLSVLGKFAWNATVDSVGVVIAEAFDSAGLEGNASKTDFFSFESDLVIPSTSVNATRVNPFGSVTFMGKVYYNGTTTPPWDSSGITVYVDLAGSTVGSTSSFDGYGNFSVTATTEATLGAYDYTVYSLTDATSVQNQTVQVIVDGLSVDSYAVDMGASKVYVYVAYAYDGSDVDGGTASFVGLTALTNGTGWATFDMALASDFSWSQTAYGTQDNTWGITYRSQNQTVPVAKSTFFIKSDVLVSTLTWNNSLLTVQFSGVNGSYSLDVSSMRPTYVVNCTYDLSTDYTTYLELTHDGTSTIVLGFLSWGGLYVNSVGHPIETIAWQSQTLVISLRGTLGETGSAGIYVGSRGPPQSTGGFAGSTNYDPATTMFTGSYTFLSGAVVLALQFGPSSPTGPGQTETFRVGNRSINASGSFTIDLLFTVYTIHITSIDWGNYSWFVVKDVLPATFTGTGNGSLNCEALIPGNATGKITVPFKVYALGPSGEILSADAELTVNVVAKRVLPPYAFPLGILLVIMIIVFACSYMMKKH